MIKVSRRRVTDRWCCSHISATGLLIGHCNGQWRHVVLLASVEVPGGMMRRRVAADSGVDGTVGVVVGLWISSVIPPRGVWHLSRLTVRWHVVSDDIWSCRTAHRSIGVLKNRTNENLSKNFKSGKRRHAGMNVAPYLNVASSYLLNSMILGYSVLVMHLKRGKVAV